MEKILESLELKFTSGNSVPVERIWLDRKEYDELLAHIAMLEEHLQEKGEELEHMNDLADRYESQVLSDNPNYHMEE